MSNKLVKNNVKEQQRVMQEAKKRKMTIIGIAAIFCVCVVIGIAVFLSKDNTQSGEHSNSGNMNNNANTNQTMSNEIYTPEPLDEALTYYADIEIETYGTITVKLEQKSAPITCANFVKLANDGFYDGLKFHRIQEGFMMQGGDPKANGTGGSEFKIVGEFPANGYENHLSHTRGAISMARAEHYDSARSQFFIVHEDYTDLDGNYAVFGYVTDGMDVVDAVCEGKDGYLMKDEMPVITTIKIRTE